MSLRDRIGRIWARGNGNSQNASADSPPCRLGHQSLRSETDAHLQTEAAKPHEPSLSPRKLHKAASMTFQVFSNTIRSRAQAFYVNSSQVEADSSATPEPKTPKKSPRRSTLWSSVRSRKSRSDSEGVLAPDAESETLPKEKLSSIGPAPVLSLQILGSSLGDYQIEDDVTTPPVTPDRLATRRLTPTPSNSETHGPRQHWHTPQMLLRNLSTMREGFPNGISEDSEDQGQPCVTGEDASAAEAPRETADQVQSCPAQEPSPADNAPVNLDPMETFPASDHDEPIQSAASRWPENFTVGASDRNAGAVMGPRMRSNTFSEDPGYMSDADSNTETHTTNTSTARTSISRPSSFVKRLRESSQVFDNASQPKQDFKGTFWPAAKVHKCSKFSSCLPTGNGSTALAIEAPVDVDDQAVDPQGEHLDFCLSAEKDQQERGSKDLDDGKLPEITRVSSELYEADNEAAANSPHNVSMGSRAVWEESRAQRNKRHAAIHLDWNTDEDSDFGFELKAEPTHLFVRAANEEPYEGMEFLREPDAIPNESLEENARWVSRIFNKGQQVATLLAIDFLRGSAHQDLEMTKTPGAQHPVSASSKTLTTPTIPIDEYHNDKYLRHRLLVENTEFALGEMSNGQDVSTAEDRFFITPELDALDPFEAKVANFGYRSPMDSQLNQNNGLAAMNTRSILGPPGSDMTTDIHAAEPCNPACFVPLPYSASEEELSSRTSQLPLSEKSAAKSPILSRLLERGRTGAISYPWAGQRRSARALGKITPVKRCVSTSSIATSASSSSASSFSFDQGENKQEPRLRLADISMVKRREALRERAMYNGLCRFVYNCEEESEADVSSECPEGEEGEKGYTAATFRGRW
ncbi:MAG: hypothetical protein LQ341_004105 [Variospora aurantia]|nr:MAG: hypothetical protein LQ341_004105 [Variospora aurantia]